MARTSATTVPATLTGAAVTMSAPDATGDIIDTGDVRLLVTNGSGASITVTVQTTATDSGLDVADAGGSVAASGTRVFGPFPARLFAQADDAVVGAGRVLVDYSAVASVTRAVIR